MYKPGQGDEEVGGDTLDPGLVMTGTKCGDDSVRLTQTRGCAKSLLLSRQIDNCCDTERSFFF